ncbi:MAG TPA: M28 family peptidase [Syntrophales bacterium]|mgnify:FL=1|nr:M28 family peptidase [Syntrophales bacterium]HQN78736.1 M28 family peptidase [Syntrophales bacterium]HQQ27126.1 M28 family peptidase [Syntrophales bacterium]
MAKAILLILLFLAVWPLLGLARVRYLMSPGHPPSPDSPDEAVSPLVGHVRELSVRIGSRSFGEREKLKEAGEYVAEILEKAGYRPEFQRYRHGGGEFVNIVATLPGTGKDPSWVVAGAHYDTIRGTPGADDNASAVAVLLEMARLLRGSAFGRTVKLVFFTLEEPPVFRTEFMGSFVFAREARDRDQPVHAMVCLEMLGFFGEGKWRQAYPIPFASLFYPSTPDFIAVVGNWKSRKLVETVADSLRRNGPVPVAALGAPPVVPGLGLSDHRSFWEMGYPAVMVTDTAFYRNPYYHTSGDTLETLDFRRMGELVPALVAVVRQLADGS